MYVFALVCVFLCVFIKTFSLRMRVFARAKVFTVVLILYVCEIRVLLCLSVVFVMPFMSSVVFCSWRWQCRFP